MAKLTGLRICNEVEAGNIIIDPFTPEHVGPNSYDLTLGPELRVYSDVYDRGVKQPLDADKENPTTIHRIGKDGYVLYPNTLYLGHTNEIAGSNKYVPCIEGRSSIARLGIQVHLTAGFGDVGFVNQWTLEILVVKAVRVYCDVRICQIYFDTLDGEIDRLYDGKYSDGATGAVASRLWMDNKPPDVSNIDVCCNECGLSFVTSEDTKLCNARCPSCGGSAAVPFKPRVV